MILATHKTLTRRLLVPRRYFALSIGDFLAHEPSIGRSLNAGSLLFGTRPSIAFQNRVQYDPVSRDEGILSDMTGSVIVENQVLDEYRQHLTRSQMLYEAVGEYCHRRKRLQLCWFTIHGPPSAATAKEPSYALF